MAAPLISPFGFPSLISSNGFVYDVITVAMPRPPVWLLWPRMESIYYSQFGPSRHRPLLGLPPIFKGSWITLLNSLRRIFMLGLWIFPSEDLHMYNIQWTVHLNGKILQNWCFMHPLQGQQTLALQEYIFRVMHCRNRGMHSNEDLLIYNENLFEWQDPSKLMFYDSYKGSEPCI